LSWQGFKLVGDGFLLDSTEASQLLQLEPRNKLVIRPFRNGRDLSARPRHAFIIDFGLLSETEAKAWPTLFDIVRTRVKPERDTNPDRGRRTYWWRLGRTNAELRKAVAGLPRFIVTLEASKHRFFVFLPREIAPDGSLVCIACDDFFVLAVLSAQAHVVWSLAAGGRLGVGNDPRYNKTLCFDSFPFPDPHTKWHGAITDAIQKLEAHRTAAIERSSAVTMTGMYNVVEKLRSGATLTVKERNVHEIAACGVLRDLHDELDALVAKAYGWEWPLEKEVILERLIALHDERVNKEKAGTVRWLRPDYQIPRFGGTVTAAAGELDLDEATPATATPAKRATWPADVISQIGAIKKLLASQALSIADVAGHFSGAKPEIVRRHLDILEVMGEVQRNHDGRYQGAAA
jgi:hypothetical protein